MRLLFKRFLALAIDMFIIGAFIAPFGVILAFLNLNSLLKYLTYVAFLLFFCRDLYDKKGSFGKIKMQLTLKFNEDMAIDKIKYYKVVRNLTLIVWPLEAFVALVNKGKRIGDLLANTEVC